MKDPVRIFLPRNEWKKCRDCSGTSRILVESGENQLKSEKCPRCNKDGFVTTKVVEYDSKEYKRLSELLW